MLWWAWTREGRKIEKRRERREIAILEKFCVERWAAFRMEQMSLPNQISMSLLTYLPLGMPPFPTGAFVQLRISFPFPVCDDNVPFPRPTVPSVALLP